VQTFGKLLYVSLFYKNGAQKESEDFFFGGHFLWIFVSKFVEI